MLTMSETRNLPTSQARVSMVRNSTCPSPRRIVSQKQGIGKLMKLCKLYSLPAQYASKSLPNNFTERMAGPSRADFS